MTEATQSGYRVLARKYRPQRFSELVGQEAMVRTLANALRTQRIAHAYLLTGVRGVGKTTTARIIARALNCEARKENAESVEPCGECEPCRRIAESRHVDVIEMDAASRTGVDDIREIIDSVAYAPVSARYKVYIIDEVHMLSRSAFNALLKTLEEPPPHVVFVFATTEIHKVPVTVLSRCQRFDLRRVAPEVLMDHLKTVAEREHVTVDDEALRIIARVAEGSVRDALSLLDQAIAFAGTTIGGQAVREMLGLADHAAILDLLDASLTGRAEDVLAQMTALRTAGQDPVLLITDLTDALHWLTRIAVTREALKDPLRGPAERRLAERLAADGDMGRLQRAWQMLLKALEEVRLAPQPMDAAEMALLRIAHAAGLPTPAEALAWLRARKAPPVRSPQPSSAAGGQGSGSAMAADPAPSVGHPSSSPAPAGQAPFPPPAEACAGGAGAQPAMRPVPDPASAQEPAQPAPRHAAELVALFHAQGRGRLATLIKDRMRVVRMRPGLIAIGRKSEIGQKDLGEIRRLLTDWTGAPWQIVISSEEDGDPPLREQEEEERRRWQAEAEAHPVVQALHAAFPQARVLTVRRRTDSRESAGSQEPAPRTPRDVQ